MRQGYHRAVLPDGTVVEGPLVVVTDAEGHLSHIERLDAERPFTTWVGGTFRAVCLALLMLPLRASAGDADSTAWEQAIEQMVVTATRTPKLLKDVPLHTRIISAEDIRRADVTTVAQLLQEEMPGVEFSWAMSREVSLNLSGFGGNSVLFLVDGERLAGETMDNPDYQRLPLDNVERIEIVRGAASSLYGAGALGGVVNIITRKAAKPLEVNLGAHIGSHQEHRHGLRLSAKHSHVANALSAAYTHCGRYEMRPFAGGALVAGENHTWNLSDCLTFTPSSRLTLSARAGYYYREREYDASENNRYRDFNGGLKGVLRFGQGHTLEVGYTFDQYDKSDYSLVTRYDVRDYSNVQNALRAICNVRPHEHLALTAGGDVMRDYLKSYMFSSGGRSQTLADAFLQADYEPARQCELLASARYDYYSVSQSSSFTARLATRYRPQHNLTLRASYSGGFRAPTLKEMYMDFDMAGIFMIYGSHGLKAERSHNFQAGVECSAAGWNLTAQTSYNIVSDRITTVWDATAAGLYGNMGAMRYQNIGSLGIFSAEANVSRRFARHWDARLSYCYSHVHVRSSELYTDNTRPHSLTARLGYETTLWRKARLSAMLSARYMSRLSVYELDDSYTQMNYTPTSYSPYSILKLSVQLALNQGVTFHLAADNLLDYKPGVYTYYSPKTTGTTFSCGVNYEL